MCHDRGPLNVSVYMSLHSTKISFDLRQAMSAWVVLYTSQPFETKKRKKKKNLGSLHFAGGNRSDKLIA